MDLGYFGEENLDLPEDSTFIGVGHSLGLIKLAYLNVEFNVLVGIQAFVNFFWILICGYTKKRKLELKAVIQRFQIDPMGTLTSFHKRCSVIYNSFNQLNKQN
ncbi:MAG: hypothetical protein ACR5KV_00645 [Wolbachia sp.]